MRRDQVEDRYHHRYDILRFFHTQLFILSHGSSDYLENFIITWDAIHRGATSRRGGEILPDFLKQQVSPVRLREASVSFGMDTPNPGWHAPLNSAQLENSLPQTSLNFFGNPAIAMGCGGGIPFMEFLAVTFPKAQLVVTGVLGPLSNAHGPNEFLDIPTAKKVTACVAQLIHDCAANNS